jgi:hypothetical protein
MVYYFSHAYRRYSADGQAKMKEEGDFIFQSIFSLTQEQCKLLDFLGDYKRVLTKGCAGSGKTMIIENSVSNV